MNASRVLLTTVSAAVVLELVITAYARTVGDPAHRPVAPKPLIHVANNAALSQLTIYAEPVLRDAFSLPDDGGFAFYVHSDGACSLNGGRGDEGAQVLAADGGCWTAEFTGEGREVRIWGAKADGATDDTRAIKAAIGSLAGGNGTLVLSAGRYLVSGPLSVGRGSVRFKGSGKNVTFIETTSSTANIVEYGGTAFDGEVSDLTLGSVASSSRAGCAIAISNGVGDIHLRNLRVGRSYHGFCMTNPAVTGVASLSHIDFENALGDTVLVDGASQLFMSGVTSIQTTTPNPSCIHIVSAGGFYFQNVTCGGSVYGLIVKPPAGKSVFDGFITNFEADDCQTVGAGLAFDSSAGGKIWDIRGTNLRAGFGQGVGFYFAGTNTSHLNVTNFTSNRNALEGLMIEDLQDSSFSDGQVLGNSSTASGHAGIDLAGGMRLTFRDIRSTNLYPGSSASNQTYGFQIRSAFTGVGQILGGDVTGNTTGGLINNSKSTGLTIKDVRGYNPVGVRHRTLDASPWTYTAGASPETEIFSDGSCSNLKVDGQEIPIPGGTFTVPVGPGQTMTGACAVNPRLSSVVQ